MLSSIVRVALSQRYVALLMATFLAVSGVWAFWDLPIDAYPDLSTTQVQVIVKAQGMTPLEVEQRITQPIETEVRGIPHQTGLRSMTKYALALVTIDFEDGTDIYWARQQVNERIGLVLGRLPAGVEGGLAPITSPLSDIFMFLVEGEGRTNRELRSILDWEIRPRLLPVPGVADVNALGGEVRSYQVEADPERLRAYDLTLADVERALRENNQNVGGDRIVSGDQVLLVRTVGQLRNRKDIAALTVASRKGVPIHVEDVASVSEGAMTRHGAVTRDGVGEAVQGLVLLRRGANGRQTVRGVKSALREIQRGLPKDVRLRVLYDRSELIGAAVATVRDAVLLAVALVLVVLVLFLGNLRSALTAGVVLPLTVLGVFLPMRLFGMSANLMSLGGLAIAIGVLVDAAVVVTENIHSRLSGSQKGQPRLHVVFRATSEVARPVFAGVVIIVVSFAPIFTLSGVEGKLFRPLAATIVVALVTSLVLSLTVIPVLASFLMRGGRDPQGRLLRALLGVYRPILDFVLRRRRLAIGGAVLLLLGAGAIFPFIGREFIPTLDEGTIVVQTEKVPNISLEKSLEIDLQIQRALKKVPEVLSVVSRTGADELRLDPMGLNETDSFFVLRPRSEWREKSTAALQGKLRGILEQIPGIKYGFTQPIDMRVSEMLTGVRAAVAIKVFGDHLETLDRTARQVERIVRSVRGAVDVIRAPLTGQRYLQIALEPGAMSRVGVTVEDANILVRTAIGGESVTEVLDGVRRIPVVLRFPPGARSTPERIAEMTLRTPGGGQRQLKDLARIEEVDGPVQIARELGKRVVVIQANVEGRDVVGFVSEVKRRIGRQVRLPEGSFVEYGGQFENERRASLRLALVIPLALLAVFLLLLATFRSLRQSALVLLNVPFALIGGIVALYLAGLYLSVPASVGLIALLGMAIMNGVVLVNHYNELREQGLDLDTAVRSGSERRLRPVLMTALLTIIGLMPLLLATGPGSEIQRPLAVVVVGGTFTATVLTLVLLPTIYAWIEARGQRLTGGEPRGEQ
ncbi:MAG: CusA/CzcA family heavy metal efflux RND transporter [Polyangia bacterium]|nr:CusA/CzcA family heavy metal efflux RND transporter [Polyangia bacterium]